MTSPHGNQKELGRPAGQSRHLGSGWLRRLGVLGVALWLVTACGDAARPGYDDGGDASDEGGGPTGPCEEGAQRACGVTLEQANGVLSCYRGRQYCEDGRWSSCRDGEITREPAPDSLQLQEFRRALALSTPVECEDDPCDPTCMYYAEDPVPDVSGGSITGIPDYPGKPPSCEHPLCETGAALNLTCNACVASVCAVDSTCCTTAWTSSCVDLVYQECANQRPPFELCDFGIYSDSTVSLANRSSSNAVIGAYGNIEVSTDSRFTGIVSTGNISFANLNGADVNAPRGILANGSVSFASSAASRIYANVEAGTSVNVFDVKITGSVRAGTNIMGQSGGQIWGDAYANGTITTVAVSPGTAHPNYGFTPLPVSLPPQNAGSSIPTFPVDCSGTTNFSGSGITAVIPGPGVYGDVDITNNGTLTLRGQGTYYLKSLQVSNRIVLDPDGAAITTGWDVRVCNRVTLRNGTKIVGGTGVTNDSNGVMLSPKLLSLYFNGTDTVALEPDVYWTGVLISPRAAINKVNMNSAPSLADILSGTRSAPVNGGLWGKSVSLGTDALTKGISKEDCQSLPVHEFFPERSCPVIDDGVPPALNEPCVSGRDCQINHRCVEPDTGDSCAHSKCMVGAKLSAGCDECVSRICEAQPSCCSGSWTQECVDRVATNCDAVCGQSDCAQSVCSVGQPINATCDSCVASVCAAPGMASCCTTAWTSACVAKAYEVCGSGTVTYPIGNSICDYAVYGNGAVALQGGSGAGAQVTVTGGKVGGQGLGALSVMYAQVNDDILTAGSLYLSGSTVNGSVVQNSAAAPFIAATTITGSTIQNAAVPSAPRPTRTFTCTGTATPTSGAIAPGDYGPVTVPNGSTLTLAAGTYTFQSLTLGSGGAPAILQLPSSGRVSINVCGAVTFETQSHMAGLTQSTALNLDVYATGAITFKGQNTAYGFLNSNTEISLDNYSTLYGMAISGSAASVKTGSRVDVTGLADDCRLLGHDPSASALSSAGRLCAYGLYGSGKYWGSNGVTVYGDVGAAGGMDLITGTYVGNVLSSAEIAISGTGNVVRGDLRSKTSIGTSNPITVYGSRVAPDATLPTPNFPAPAFQCPTGGASDSWWWGTTKTLAPGSYGDIMVGTGANLTLQAGTYYLTSLTLDGQNQFALPATGTVTLYVCGKVAIRNGSLTQTGITTPTAAQRLRIFSNHASTSATDDAITVDTQSTTNGLSALLIAPRGNIRLNASGAGTRLNGVAWGKEMYTGTNTVIDSRGATGAACEALGIDAPPPCPVTLTPTVPSETAECVQNAPTYRDTRCLGYDLAVDIPCDDQVPVCNHGTVDFSGTVEIGYWADAQNQMSTPTPVVSPTGVCSQTVSIAAGACAPVTCAIPAGVHTVMVDPDDALAECSDHRLDNWSVHDGRSCSGGGVTSVSYDYEAICPEGTSGRWGLLTWDTTTPGTSNVVFSGRTAPTRAGLASATYAPLGTASAAAGTTDCAISGPAPNCPVDITGVLGLGFNQHQFLEVRMQLNSGDGSPILHDWKITYSCVFDQ